MNTEEEYYFVDASVDCCSLTITNLEHLADECYTEGASIDITGRNFRFYFKLKSNAKAFGGFYKLHYTKDDSGEGINSNGVKKK